MLFNSLRHFCKGYDWAEEGLWDDAEVTVVVFMFFDVFLTCRHCSVGAGNPLVAAVIAEDCAVRGFTFDSGHTFYLCAVFGSLTACDALCVCSIGLHRVVICGHLVQRIARACVRANRHRSFGGACRVVCVIVCVCGDCVGAAGFGSPIVVHVSISHAHRREELWVREGAQLDPSDQTHQPSNFVQ